MKATEKWFKYINERESKKVEAGETVKTISLPKLRISEQWGEPGSDDRKIIEMFTGKITGTTFQEKINSIQKFVAACDENCVQSTDVAEILGNLVFLDALSSVIYDFNAMTGGFLFEALVSALLGGQSRQVPTGGGKDQDVVDIYDHAGVPLSLKFFKATGSKYIKGSYNNLRTSIVKEGRPIIYLIGIKNTSGDDTLSIDFYQFSVGLHPEDNEKLPENERIVGDYDYTDLGNWHGVSTSDIIGTPKRRTRSGGYYVASLDLGSREDLQKTAERYVERLGDTLLNIYQQLDLLSGNVNKYFLGAPEEKNAGMKAQENAKNLKQSTEEL